MRRCGFNFLYTPLIISPNPIFLQLKLFGNLALRSVTFSEDVVSRVFADSLENDGIIKALCLPSGSQKFSNTAVKKGDIYSEAIKSGVKGLPFLKVLDNGDLEGVPALVSSLGPGGKERFLSLCSAKPGDLILFAVGHNAAVNKTLDKLRLFSAQQMGLIDNSRHSVLWVTDFPMFEWNDTEHRFEALHHPFTAPNPDDIDNLSSAPALAYDMVYNGVEIGGGSLRIYKREVQEKVLEIVGISPKQSQCISSVSSHAHTLGQNNDGIGNNNGPHEETPML